MLSRIDAMVGDVPLSYCYSFQRPVRRAVYGPCVAEKIPNIGGLIVFDMNVVARAGCDKLWIQWYSPSLSACFADRKVNGCAALVVVTDKWIKTIRLWVWGRLLGLNSKLFGLDKGCILLLRGNIFCHIVRSHPTGLLILLDWHLTGHLARLTAALHLWISLVKSINPSTLNETRVITLYLTWTSAEFPTCDPWLHWHFPDRW